MRVAILRRSRNASVSMDVYADSLIGGLKTVRPDWEIIELSPSLNSLTNKRLPAWLKGCQKYYESYWRYPRSLKHQTADIFHVVDHSEGHLCAWLKGYGKKNVVTCHDLINLVQPEAFEGKARLPLISMAIWRNAVKSMIQADRIISVSNHTKKDIINSLGIEATKISVIPNAVDEIFQPIATKEIAKYRQSKGLTSEHFCLLNVGSNNSRKNLITILQVLASLKAKDIPVHFWKAGKDFTPQQQSYIKQQDLTTHITYLGQPSIQELIAIYNAADLLVAPSTYEGFGLTVLEAMASGLAVLTSNVTSLPEVAGEAAILVDPLDTKKIVAEIINLYCDRQAKQKLIDKGLAHSALFTWKNTAEQVAQIYEKTLSK